MNSDFNILSARGVEVFSNWIRNGARTPAPLDMLDDMEFCTRTEGLPRPDRRGFADKMEFGEYLTELLADVKPALFFNNHDFWATLSLLWFDELRLEGKNPGSVHRYVSTDDFKIYRHLVRSCWLAYRDHGENARFMLTSSKDVARPLSVFSDPLDRMAANQRIISSRKIVHAANKLFIDPESNRPWPGVAGAGKGGVRRLAATLNQLDLTFDPESMTTDAFIAVLPKEFDIWREKLGMHGSKSDLQAA